MKKMWVIHSWPWYWLVWPWWGGRMYWIMTRVSSNISVPSTYLDITNVMLLCAVGSSNTGCMPDDNIYVVQVPRNIKICTKQYPRLGFDSQNTWNISPSQPESQATYGFLLCILDENDHVIIIEPNHTILSPYRTQTCWPPTSPRAHKWPTSSLWAYCMSSAGMASVSACTASLSSFIQQCGTRLYGTQGWF